MPVSPAQALRGRTRRRVAGSCACAVAALAFTPAARATDRELTVSATSPQAWTGRTAPSMGLFEPATLIPCGGSAADVCDSTLLHVEGGGTLSLGLAASDAGTPDVDLYVYRSDPFGLPGLLAGVSAGPSPAEAVDLPAASGDYLVRAVSFASGKSGFAATAALTLRAPAPPDVDRPRGRQEALVSDPRAGAASQPAVAADGDTLITAYRVFPDAAAYVSQMATAVSFDSGREWLSIGAVSPAPAANPALAFTRGDAVLVTGEPGLTVRRWTRPSRLDVLRHRTWEAPQPLSTPPAAAVDERPVLAAAGDRLMACWARTTDLGAYTRQAVLCRHSPDGGVTWEAERQPSPAHVTGVPYGPYVGGVALVSDHGAFTAAWVDTLGGVLDGSGIDSAWVSRSTDGAGWSAPVRAARFRPLPDRFPGDAFRNVTLLALAAAHGRLYLAYAEAGPEVRLVRSDDGGAHWGEPRAVGTGFQPAVAVTGRRVFVTLLDRRLDPAGRFADEWLASSRDGGDTWRQRRLSHDSWDPSVGAPHSPTGDLLGDHQAVAVTDCNVIALAADPHLAAPPRDPGFDHHWPRPAVPQLFAWRVRHHC